METILFYGDSNTYGFDPRDGSRYPASVRWTSLVAKALDGKYIVRTDGLNGRRIPDVSVPAVRTYLEASLKNAMPFERFAVMLGTNDLYWPMHPDPVKIARDMEAFLSFTGKYSGCRMILLIAPPCLPGLSASAQLTALYRALAEKCGYGFADAGRWNIEMSFDGVHFSEAGHAQFAAEILGLGFTAFM